MWRVAVGIMIAGAALTFYGCREYRLGSGASSAPEPITIEELSRGVPDNPYRTLGPHAAVLDQMIYSGKKNSDRVDAAFYPVVSPDDAYFAGKRRGNPGLAGRVLVKVTRWRSKSELGSGLVTTGLTGMVINKVSPLSSTEANFLSAAFPGTNADKLIIFEEGRTPTSAPRWPSSSCCSASL